VLQRHPRRISISLSHAVHEALLSRSDNEGRSVSNLCAYLLEHALEAERHGEVADVGSPGRSDAPGITRQVATRSC
jgi:macrodomain Ter protein organizer (MatP/YcbG family)